MDSITGMALSIRAKVYLIYKNFKIYNALFDSKKLNYKIVLVKLSR